MQEQQHWHTWQDRSTSLSKLLWFYCQNLPNGAKKSLGNGLHGFHFAIPLVFDGLCASGYVCSVDGSLSQRASGESVLHFPRLEVFGRGLREHGTVKGDQGTYFEVKFELCENKQTSAEKVAYSAYSNQGEITLSICPLSSPSNKEDWCKQHGQQSRELNFANGRVRKFVFLLFDNFGFWQFVGHRVNCGFSAASGSDTRLLRCLRLMKWSPARRFEQLSIVAALDLEHGIPEWLRGHVIYHKSYIVL